MRSDVSENSGYCAHDERRTWPSGQQQEESGTLRGKRTTGGGRVDVRNALFMPTVVAKQFNPTIRNFYNRLVESGKAKMTAIIAAMRKLLTILNTLIKNQTPWNPPKTP